MGRRPGKTESFVPDSGVYAFNQEAAPAWAWSMDRDNAQMKTSIPRELGQDLVEHQSVVDNHKSHVKALEFALGGSFKAWCANLSGMYPHHTQDLSPALVMLPVLLLSMLLDMLTVAERSCSLKACTAI